MKDDPHYDLFDSINSMYDNEPPGPAWKRQIYRIVFQSDTRLGRLFDLVLSTFILTNIMVLLLESVPTIGVKYNLLFRVLDNVYLVFFSIEVLLRIICVRWPKRYIFSFYGLIDLLAILPSFLEFIFPQTHVLMLVRCFRLLRVFRIFGLVKFLKESRLLLFSLIRSLRKIIVFLFFVLLLTVFLGALMYVLEYKHNPQFNSIPQSIYWAIVTITTVGYGDVSPITASGKIVASFIMILGYAIIAVPTGIISSGMIKETGRLSTKRKEYLCPHCLQGHHEQDALFCKYCGEALTP